MYKHILALRGYSTIHFFKFQVISHETLRVFLSSSRARETWHAILSVLTDIRQK